MGAQGIRLPIRHSGTAISRYRQRKINVSFGSGRKLQVYVLSAATVEHAVQQRQAS